MSSELAVVRWSRTEKVHEALKRSLPLLPDGAAALVSSLLTPKALATIVGVLVIWAGSHFFGVGEIADCLLLVAGFVALGWSAIEAAQELMTFADCSLNAESEEDLDEAARAFAHAITLIGVEAVMTLLLKSRPKTFQAKHIDVGPAPKTKGSFNYKPTTTDNPELKAGEGFTTAWGDVEVSTRGTLTEQRLVQIHEKVHQFLTPKLHFLRRVRVSFSANAYQKSFLLRYIEEALAETVAQVRVNGLRSATKGIVFPVKNGYVTIAQLSSEALGSLLGPINVAGMGLFVYYSPRKPRSKSVIP